MGACTLTWGKKYGDKSGHVFAPTKNVGRGVAEGLRNDIDLDAILQGEHLRYSTKPRRECSLLVANTISPLCGNPVESRVVSFYPWHAADIVTFDLLAQGLYRPPTLYETYPPLQVSWNARQHALDFTDNDIRNERFRYCQHFDRILLLPIEST